MTSEADITTKGVRSAGILAQAIGGGGGVMGDATSDTPGPATVGSSGGDGASDVVTITMNGGSQVMTAGQCAHGVFAQSAAASDGKAGNVTINVFDNAHISDSGTGAAGIFAQSVGHQNQLDTISITIDATLGSANDFAAILVRDGIFGNTVIVAGTVEAGMTVKYEGTAGLDIITLDGGKIKGQTHLPKGTLQINEVGIVQSTGPMAAEYVKNNGQRTLGSPDPGELQTSIAGDFAQGKPSVLILDLAPSDQAHLWIDGKANLDGKIKVNMSEMKDLHLFSNATLVSVTNNETADLNDSLEVDVPVASELDVF